MNMSVDSDERVDEPSRAFQRSVVRVLCCAVYGVVCCVLCGVCCVLSLCAACCALCVLYELCAYVV